MTPCAVCGAQCVVIRHPFFEGVGRESVEPGRAWRPVREWFIDAPLYFQANADFTACEAAFCGPVCATSAFALRLDTADG